MRGQLLLTAKERKKLGQKINTSAAVLSFFFPSTLVIVMVPLPLLLLSFHFILISSWSPPALHYIAWAWALDQLATGSFLLIRQPLCTPPPSLITCSSSSTSFPFSSVQFSHCLCSPFPSPAQLMIGGGGGAPAQRQIPVKCLSVLCW